MQIRKGVSEDDGLSLYGLVMCLQYFFLIIMIIDYEFCSLSKIIGVIFVIELKNELFLFILCKILGNFLYLFLQVCISELTIIKFVLDYILSELEFFKKLVSIDMYL